MRIKQISPVLGAALVASGLAFVAATPSEAAPVKLYFHSESGSYQDDWLAAPDSFGVAAPPGSTLSATAPTKTADATAAAFTFFGWSSEPLSPTFTLPFTGDVTSLCIDIWAQSVPDPETTSISTYTSINVEPPFGDAFTTVVTEKYAGDLIRITAMVKPNGADKFTVAKDSEFAINGAVPGNPEWTMYYDSVTHPSSVTFNATECKATPVVVPSGTPSATASATATPTASASATATPSPSGSATATPTVTPTATATPTPTVTTPPAPAQETGLAYTGATAGRYSDLVPVSARVTLPDGRPVPTGNVEFQLGTVKATFPVRNDGIASGTLRVGSAAGEHILTASYLANSAYLSSTKQVPFTVSRMPGKCTISRTTTSNGYLITGTLRDAANRAIVGQPVFFAYNGTTHHAVKTDASGRASYPVSRRSGTHSIALRTSDLYTGCAASLRV